MIICAILFEIPLYRRKSLDNLRNGIKKVIFAQKIT